MTLDDRSRPRRVLLIGGKPDGALDGLADLGAEVVCVGLPKHVRSASRRRGVVRAVGVDDPANVEDVLLALRRDEVDLDQFDVAASGLEYGLVAAAVIGELCGARAIPVATAVLLRDKHAQKSAVRRGGIPAPRSCPFLAPAALADAIDAVGGLPAVVKPAAGAGARDTTVLRSGADVDLWRERNEAHPWLCEEFVAGPELHLDGVVRNGRPAALAASRYFANMVDVQNGALSGSALIPERDEPEVHQKAWHLAAAVTEALAFTDGVFHLEVFEQPDGSLVFSECAGRVGGSRIDDMVRLGCGLDLHREWAAAAVGADRPPVPVRADGPDAVVGCLDLHAPQGQIIGMPSVEEIVVQSGVVQAELKLRVGSRMTAVQDTNTRAGRAVLTGSTFEQVQERSAELARWFLENTTVS